jgi:NDP-sugar pyrophosphorylase family protein
MWPLTAEVPKGLLPLGGLPFVEYQIRQLAAIGVEEIVLTVGRSLVEAWADFAAGSPEDVHVRLAIEDEPLDTAGPVRAVLDSLDDRFFVLNGDVVLEADIAAVAAGAGEFGNLGLVEVDDTGAYGVVVVGEGGLVERFVEKPPGEAAPARTVNAGIYALSRDALAPYPPGRLSFEHVVFPDLAAAGGLGGVTLTGRWMDIGTPTLYLDTHGVVMTGGSGVHRPPSSHVAPVGVAPSGAWVWIAPDAAIAPGALVEESVVFAGASIGEGAVVRRAVIGPRARIERGVTVAGDSLVGADAVVGESCQLDHGARIAPGAVIGAGAVTFRPPE